MKVILVPTDFSRNAENASMYALRMNQILNSDVHLFHSYIIPVFATDVPISVPDLPGLKIESQKHIQALKDKLGNINSQGSKEIVTAVAAGYPEQEIPAYAKDIKADLVVMGTKGATGLKEVFFGTITAGVIGKLHCPLLIIPENVEFTGFKRIVFATNYAENDIENISEVIQLAKNFNSEVVILHVSLVDSSKPFENNTIETFTQKLRELNDYNSIKYKLLNTPDLESGINEYLNEANADLVVMTNRNRSLFQKLFDRSLTIKMAYHTHIPLLVYHVKERGSYFL